MSGPKCDSIRVSPEVAQRIERQRQEEMKRSAVSQHSRYLRELTALERKLTSYRIDSIAANTDDATISEALASLSDKRQAWVKQLKQLVSQPLPNELNAILRYYQQLDSASTTITRQLEEGVEAIKNNDRRIGVWRRLSAAMAKAKGSAVDMCKQEIMGGSYDHVPAQGWLKRVADICATSIPSERIKQLQQAEQIAAEVEKLIPGKQGLQKPSVVDTSSRTGAALAAAKEKWLTKLDALYARPLPKDASGVIEHMRQFVSELDAMRRSSAREVGEAEERLHQFAGSVQRLAQHEVLAQTPLASPEQVAPVVEAVFSKGLSGDDQEQALVIATEVLLAEISAYLGDELTKAADKQELEALVSYVVEGAKTNSNAQRKSLERVKGLFQLLRQRLDIDKEALEQAYAAYAAECRGSGICPQAIAEFASVEKIVAETRRIRESEAERLAQVYIREQIDDVMKTHGYNVIDSDYLEAPPDGTRRLYEVDAASGINVFQSEQGMLMIEIVATGDDTRLSEHEKLMMVERQRRFCGVYADLRADLNARGVVLKTIDHKEPHISFSRKLQVRAGKHSQARPSQAEIEGRRVMQRE